MSLYTISDLHLPLGIDKPMDIFGKTWENYVEKLFENWQRVVKDDDLVVLPGDFSWATYIEQSKKDFEFLDKLNGQKIILKGNHDYWWTTMNKLNTFVKDQNFHSIRFLQNNSFLYKDIAICGTRGWNFPSIENFSADDLKIYEREIQRLELSLKDSQKYDHKEKFVFIHYPPIAKNILSTRMSDLMKNYGVTKCIYGHLHAASHKNAVEGVVDGIEYKLVSCDYIQFTPYKLTE